MYPAYLNAYNNGTLDQLIEKSTLMLESCSICPRMCGVNRLKGELGFCKTGARARVCSFMPHFGEEPPVSGSRGSGTIFFSHCNMGCVYCQNYEFSQLGEGREVGKDELAKCLLDLQAEGCHNINFVTPTHVLPQILSALKIAAAGGLKIPIVYNSGGYELAKILKLLEGIVDIYMPDMRYADPAAAKKYSLAPDYPRYNREALKTMHRQVGIAKLDNQGIIIKGVIIRHLVLPDNISGTERIMKFIAGELSRDTYISLMSQYTPYHKAEKFPQLKRRISHEEYESAKVAMARYGLHNGWVQECGGLQRFAGVNIKPAFDNRDD
ncbi:radical SAM protein [Candidatus Omnitrophota bacterium]